jgi:hypothetical protein
MDKNQGTNMQKGVLKALLLTNVNRSELGGDSECVFCYFLFFFLFFFMQPINIVPETTKPHPTPQFNYATNVWAPLIKAGLLTTTADCTHN